MASSRSTTSSQRSTGISREPGSQGSSGKKRDSRAGMRKVTSLTAEQLERKRANDREAQRTIRARTKEHIENLEQQVAELSAKGQQVDRVLERNAALEAEIAHLRQQLAMMTSRQLYQSEDERRSSTSSNPASVISSPFNSPPMTDAIPQGAPSIPPLTHRMSLPQGSWHAYAPSSIPTSVSGPDTPGETVVGPTSYAMPDSIGQGHHDMGYAQYSGANSESYRYSSSRGPQQQQPHHHHQQQHIPVATLGYESNMSSLPATHLPMPNNQQHHHQHPQAYPSSLIHSPPSHAHVSYPWDSRG